MNSGTLLRVSMYEYDGSMQISCNFDAGPITVEPPNKGHFGGNNFVPCR